MAQPLRRIDVDENALERDSHPPSIADVALGNAVRGGITIDLTSSVSPDPIDNDIDDAEGIVVDLRSAVLLVHTDATIDLSATRESPSAPNSEALAPVSSQTHSELFAQPLSGLVTATPAQRLAKRAIDIVFTLIMLVVLAPLMLIVAALVMLSSPGTALYRSTRVGKDGQEFVFLKFRTMHTDADSNRDDYASFNEQTGPVFKMERDPRITPIGRVLRRASIDELPQLFHVLSGKMSLVGPRPPIPLEVAQYDARTHQRLLVKPGITCIWQVSGRSTIDFDTWIEMDLEYIESWSVIGDLGLLVRTIPAVLGGEGAY